MKKVLPCRSMSAVLLFLMTFFVMNVNGQTCIDSRTLNPVTLQPTVVACAGDNLLWQTTTIGGTNGEPITWEIIADTSGGAVFVASGTNVYATTFAGAINTALVHLGPNAGTVTVRMSFNNTPGLGTCSSSGIAKILRIAANAPPVRCHDDLTTVSIIAAQTGTQIVNGGAIIQLPGDCGNYTYALLTNPGGAVVQTNTTGVFPNVAPGDYRVRITDCGGCNALSAVVQIANPAVVPVDAICANNSEASACQYANQDAVNAAFASWLEDFHATGGTGTLTEVFTPAVPQAPNACGGVTEVRYRVTDECGQADECTATFRVLAPPALVTDAPDPVVINFCDINPGTLAAQFQAFLDGFTKSGGCNPSITFDAHGTPNVCGGPAIVVRAVVRDKCHDDVVLQSTFDVRAALAPRVTQGDNVNLGACLTQGVIDDAFIQFLGSVSAIGDCGPINVTHDAAVAPTVCLGGDVPVTFRINTRCFDEIVIVKHFVVATPTAPTLQCAPNATIACDAQFNHTAPTPSGGCGALTVNVISTVVSPDGQTSTRTWDVTDACGRHSAQCSQVITKEPCDFNGCTLGYWKNHTLAWNCYSTCTLYKDVFINSTLPANLTLLQALNLGGGACNNLARQSVAALLNICEGLPYHIANEQALKDAVNAAFLAGNCGPLGAQLDGFNNEGGANHCNVVKSPNTSAPTPGVCAGGRVGNTNFKIAPNPSRNDFKLFIPDSTDVKLNMTVFDMTGRVVDRKVLNAKDGKEVQFGNNYPMGMYTVVIEGPDGTQTVKISKQ